MIRSMIWLENQGLEFMLPSDRSQPNFRSRLNAWLYKLREWIRQEIVDDDPWDDETLFPDGQNGSGQPIILEPAKLETLTKQPPTVDDYSSN